MCASEVSLVYQKNTIVGIGPTFSNDSPFCRGDPSQYPLRRLFPKSNLQYGRTAAGPAVRFAASNPNLEVASWPIFTNGNSNVLPQSNEFLGYDPDPCGLTSGTGIAAEGFSFGNSPFPGRITEGGGLNVQKDQVRRAAGTLVLGEEIRLSGRGLRLTYAVKMFFRANEELSLGGCRGRLAVLGN